MNTFAITGALLYDGSGKSPCPADVVVKDSRIAAVAPAGFLNLTGTKKIDGCGLSLAPGFIDAHGHSDISILAAPEAAGKLSQGITLEIVGNCGLSAFPVLTPEVREHLQVLYAKYDVPITWSDLNGYAAELERRSPAIHIASLCGHNTLRANFSGYTGKKLSGQDRGRMKQLLTDMLHQGAAGLSSGLLYTPGRFADTEELLALMEILKETDKPYTTHLRSEGDTLIEALDEAIFLARHGSGRLQVSHLKTALPRNWHKLDAVLNRIRNARSAAMRVTADRYPYTYSQTSLSIILPPPYDAMDDQTILRKLADDPAEQATVAKRLSESGRDWSRIILTSTNCARYGGFSGSSIAETASAAGLSPAHFCVQLLAEDAPGAMAAFPGMSEENMKRILAEQWVCCGTDESARPFDFSIGRSHPRGFGSMPEFIRLVAENSSMSEAVRRVTMLPASIFALKDRGMIREGMYADLVLFDEQEFRSNATFAAPHAPASGIRLICVNGIPAGGMLLDGMPERSGSFIRI